MQHNETGMATVCGIGAVTGYGWGRKYLWEGVGVRRPSGRLTAGFGGAFAADEVWVSPVPDGGDVMDGRGRFGRAVHAAVREALEDATDRGWRPGEVVGMVHAIVLGEVELWRDFYLVHGMRRTRKQFIELMPSTPLTTIMREHDFHGPCMGVTAMCASGNAGLLTAKQWIDVGHGDRRHRGGHRHLGHARERQALRRPRRVRRRPGAARRLPPVPGGQRRLHRRRGVGGHGDVVVAERRRTRRCSVGR